jgi:DNA-directed RNA polymerase specialized sigma24 family protein
VTQGVEIAWSDVLQKTKAGQPAAWDELCRELSVRLFQIAKYRLWGWSDPDLEDIVQDCLCTFWQKLDHVESNPQAYACEILRNKIGNALQRRKFQNLPLSSDYREEGDGNRSAVDPPAVESPDDGILTGLASRDRLNKVCKAIMDLQDFCRNFFLGLVEGRTIQEMWILYSQREPDLRRNAFDKRVYDCRQRLRRLVGDEI